MEMGDRMKEKLRKLDGKPTEPGYYLYRGNSGAFMVDVQGGSGDDLYAYWHGCEESDRVQDMDGQWSERIPDCDWEGEAPPKGKAVTCRTIPLTEAQRKGLTLSKEAAEAFKRARIK